MPVPKVIGSPARKSADAADSKTSADSRTAEEDLIECPCCAELILREAILCRFCQNGISLAHFRECWSCGEMIRDCASYCRCCNSTRPFPPDVPEPPYQAPASSPARHEGWGQRKAGEYGSGVRAQVFEVIVRQAMAGAPWREICAGPMQVNNISSQEVLAEVQRRQDLLSHPGSFAATEAGMLNLADQLLSGLIDAHSFAINFMALFPDDRKVDLLRRLAQALGERKISGEAFRCAYEAVKQEPPRQH